MLMDEKDISMSKVMEGYYSIQLQTWNPFNQVRLQPSLGEGFNIFSILSSLVKMLGPLFEQTWILST